jgi:hypothetical protein
VLLATVKAESQFKFIDSDALVEIQDIVKTDGYKCAEQRLISDAERRPYAFLFPNVDCDDDSDEVIRIGVAYAKDKKQSIGRWIAQTRKPMIILLRKQTE